MATKTVSVLTGGSNNHQSTATEMNYLQTDLVSAGPVGALSNTSGVAPSTGAFAVNAIGTPNMSVRVTNGVCYVTGTPTGGASQLVRVNMDTTEDVTIAANATGGTRYDWIYISLDATKLLNPAVDASDVATLVASRSTSSSTDNGTPPTYGYCLAVVTVANGAVSIVNGNISDSRVEAGANALGATVNSSGTTTIQTATGHIALKAQGSKLVKSTVLRQDDTTNTYQSGNTVMLTGWGVVTPGVSSTAFETVTFGVTFLQRPIVVATYGGDHASSTTYGAATNATAIKLATCRAYTITTTTFRVEINTTDATNWSAGNTVFYQWTAIGEIA